MDFRRELFSQKSPIIDNWDGSKYAAENLYKML